MRVGRLMVSQSQGGSASGVTWLLRDTWAEERVAETRDDENECVYATRQDGDRRTVKGER